ncbi:mCG1037742, partial [Mus musculus]
GFLLPRVPLRANFLGASVLTVLPFSGEGNPSFRSLLFRETYSFHSLLQRVKAVCYLLLQLRSTDPAVRVNICIRQFAFIVANVFPALRSEISFFFFLERFKKKSPNRRGNRTADIATTSLPSSQIPPLMNE